MDPSHPQTPAATADRIPARSTNKRAQMSKPTPEGTHWRRERERWVKGTCPYMDPSHLSPSSNSSQEKAVTRNLFANHEIQPDIVLSGMGNNTEAFVIDFNTDVTARLSSLPSLQHFVYQIGVEDHGGSLRLRYSLAKFFSLG
jgi:hypothetical protein